jgi:hypothetical protein
MNSAGKWRRCAPSRASRFDSLHEDGDDIEALLLVVSARRGSGHGDGAAARPTVLSRGFSQRKDEEEKVRREGGEKGDARVCQGLKGEEGSRWMWRTT